MSTVDTMVSIVYKDENFFGLRLNDRLQGGNSLLETSINRGNRHILESTSWLVTPLSPINLVRWNEE